MWIIWKIDAVILFKRNMAEKDVCHAHMFCSLDCNIFFCMVMTPKVRKKNKQGSLQAVLTVFITFLFFGLKD